MKVLGRCLDIAAASVGNALMFAYVAVVAVAAVLAAIFGGWLGALAAVVFGTMTVLFVRGVIHDRHDDPTI